MARARAISSSRLKGVWEHDVEHDQVGRVGGDTGQRSLAAHHLLGFKAVVTKRRRHQVGDVPFVVDHEHSGNRHPVECDVRSCE
jgi:hypothetical protein